MLITIKNNNDIILHKGNNNPIYIDNLFRHSYNLISKTISFKIPLFLPILPQMRTERKHGLPHHKTYPGIPPNEDAGHEGKLTVLPCQEECQLLVLRRT